MAFGAASVEIACFIDRSPASGLGRLDDFARADTARADAQAPDAAVDHGSHKLEVGLEAARAHGVRVAVLPSDHGALAADFTLFGHMQNDNYSGTLTAGSNAIRFRAARGPRRSRRRRPSA